MERAALLELMLCSVPFSRRFNGGSRTEGQQRLFDAICSATAITKHPVSQTVIYEGIPTDPEELFRAYIKAGGDWQQLVAAVNRFASEAVCLRYQVQKEKSHEQKTTQ